MGKSVWIIEHCPIIGLIQSLHVVVDDGGGVIVEDGGEVIVVDVSDVISGFAVVCKFPGDVGWITEDVAGADILGTGVLDGVVDI